MTATRSELSQLVTSLLPALRDLERRSAAMNLPPLEGREWYELLQRKLIPQLGSGGYLVIAVTGGTNIGKSVVFNHLAGFRASASSPLASGTKHPVCLVPDGFAEQHNLESLFPTFQLVAWDDASQALTESERDLLFWRTCDTVPANLLIMDTPDIDSDAPVNWRRADAIRQSADVLIAVLTQQKYNDAAVKKFFRQAATEGKPAVVVFNQCELPDDEQIWPLWMETFSSETGVEPLYVYLAAKNRKAAESISLTFEERKWPVGTELPDEQECSPRRLQDVFAHLHFDDIKLRTLMGALEVVCDEVSGLPSYLSVVAGRSREFLTAAELLSAHQLAEVQDWPTPPSPLLVSEVRSWWSTQRQGWSAAVHAAYDTVGQAVISPFRWVHARVRGPRPEPWEKYRELEWAAILKAIGKVYQKLEWIADLGQPLLRDRIEGLLSGVSRQSLIDQIQSSHSDVLLGELLRDVVNAELKSFRTENPQLFQWVQRMDEATAAARPMLTIVLGVTGVGLPVGEAAAHLMSHGVMQGAMHVAGDVVAGAATATVGESAISASASSGAGYIQAKIHRLQEAFSSRRAAWLAEQLDRHLLGSLAKELQSASQVPQLPEFLELEKTCKDLRAALYSPVAS